MNSNEMVALALGARMKARRDLTNQGAIPEKLLLLEKPKKDGKPETLALREKIDEWRRLVDIKAGSTLRGIDPFILSRGLELAEKRRSVATKVIQSALKENHQH